jgi:hypothetical protein
MCRRPDECGGRRGGCGECDAGTFGAVMVDGPLYGLFSARRTIELIAPRDPAEHSGISVISGAIFASHETCKPPGDTLRARWPSAVRECPIPGANSHARWNPCDGMGAAYNDGAPPWAIGAGDAKEFAVEPSRTCRRGRGTGRRGPPRGTPPGRGRPRSPGADRPRGPGQGLASSAWAAAGTGCKDVDVNYATTRLLCVRRHGHHAHLRAR